MPDDPVAQMHALASGADDDPVSQMHALASGGQPDTSSADAVRTKGPVKRGLSAFVDTVNPIPLIKSGVGTVMDFSKDAFDAREGNFGFSRTLQNAKSASDAINHMVGINPNPKSLSDVLHNPIPESIGEKAGEGDVAGAVGESAGVGLNAYLMGGGEIPGAGGAKAYLQNKALKMYERAAKPQAWFKKLKPEVQDAALRAGVENWVPPTNSGKGKVAGLKEGVDAQRVAAEDALEQSGVRLPVDQLDQAAQVQGSTPHTFSPTSQRIRGLEDVQGRYLDTKLATADPAEIQAAKQKIADHLNAQIPVQAEKLAVRMKNGEVRVAGPNDDFHTQLLRGEDPSLMQDSGYVDSTGRYGTEIAKPEELGFGIPKPKGLLTAADITDTQLKAFNYPSTMKPSDLLNLKREYRAEIATPEGQLPVSKNGAAVDSFINHLAGTAGDIVKQASPELAKLGLQERDLINLEKMVKDSAFRVGKREFGGVATPVAAGVGAAAAGAAKTATGVGRAALIAETIRSPYIRSKLASMIYHGTNGASGLATANAFLETLARPFDAQEDNDQRNDVSVNAKQ